MFKKITNGCVNLVQRFLPDAFIFCIILTIIVFLGAVGLTGMSPLQVTIAWGGGAWSLLGFSMQMALVLVLGTAFASAPVIKKFLVNIASIPKTPSAGIILVTVVSTICCWINWGFGLVVGALLAKEIAKKVSGIDYRLLIASAYSGFVVWHGGASGSIPLQIASWNESVEAATAGALTQSVPTSYTIFSPWNIIICITILIVMTLVNVFMHPDKDHVVTIDSALLADPKTEELEKASTPAEAMERSPVLSIIITIIGVVYLAHHFATNGFSLSLDIVNTIFLMLGILLHKTPINYVNAISEAVKGAGGIILQFPFYAGIMGIMTAQGPAGTSIAGMLSDFFVGISTPQTFPLWTFLSAGIVNFFVPSGGGQWAVQAPIMMPAGLELGVSPAVTAMGIAWGDAWTNMLQPFWALPALGIAGLGARDIMGYCAVILLVTGIIIALGLLFLVPAMVPLVI